MKFNQNQIRLNFLLFLILNFMTIKALPKDAALGKENLVQELLMPDTLYFDYKGHKALTQKNPEGALQYYSNILEKHPNSLMAQMNLAIALHFLQKNEASEKLFIQVEKSLTEGSTLEKHEKFILNYNLGVFYGLQKNIEKALLFYQNALEISPSSMETKHNIELLIQQNQQDQNSKDQNNDPNNKSDKNDKDSDQDKKDNKDKNDQKDKENNKEKDQKDQGQDRKQSKRYEPRSFKGEQLSESDVKKILGELSEQDRKIRSQFNKKDRNEATNDKDW